MGSRLIHQFEFPSILYDTLFGLIIYFSLDSFLDLQGKLHLFFYLFALVLVIHWWLMFKSATDAFGEETSDSAFNLVINIVYLIIIDYIVLLSGKFDYYQAGVFLAVLLLVDLLWASVWRFAKAWDSKERGKIKRMKQELSNIISTDLLLLLPLGVLLLLGGGFAPGLFIGLLAGLYFVYIAFSFHYQIIDLKIL